MQATRWRWARGPDESIRDEKTPGHAVREE